MGPVLLKAILVEDSLGYKYRIHQQFCSFARAGQHALIPAVLLGLEKQGHVKSCIKDMQLLLCCNCSTSSNPCPRETVPTVPLAVMAVRYFAP